jgi:hypothetical protein
LAVDYYILGGGGTAPLKEDFVKAFEDIGLTAEQVISPEKPSDLSVVRGTAKLRKIFAQD